MLFLMNKHCCVLCIQKAVFLKEGYLSTTMISASKQCISKLLALKIALVYHGHPDDFRYFLLPKLTITYK